MRQWIKDKRQVIYWNEYTNVIIVKWWKYAIKDDIQKDYINWFCTFMVHLRVHYHYHVSQIIIKCYFWLACTAIMVVRRVFSSILQWILAAELIPMTFATYIQFRYNLLVGRICSYHQPSLSVWAYQNENGIYVKVQSVDNKLVRLWIK